MRTVFTLSYLANLALAVASYLILPERVATHFGAGGVPNNWGTSHMNSMIMTAVVSLLFTVLLFTPFMVRKLPAKLVSIPNSSYWLNDDNITVAISKISCSIYSFGICIMVFLFAVSLLALDANLSEPVQLNMKLFTPFWGIFMLYSVSWVINFLLKFRLPKFTE